MDDLPLNANDSCNICQICIDIIVSLFWRVAVPFSKRIIKIGRKNKLQGKIIFIGSNRDFLGLLTLDSRPFFEISVGHRVKKFSVIF